jgi:hypothetical protein
MPSKYKTMVLASASMHRICVENRIRIGDDIFSAHRLVIAMAMHMPNGRQLAQLLYGNMHGAQKMELLTTMHWQVRWASFGFPTFDLSEDLALSLLSTDCKGIGEEQVHFPFDSFLVRLPDPSPLTIDVDGRPKPAIWVMHHRIIHGRATPRCIELEKEWSQALFRADTVELARLEHEVMKDSISHVWTYLTDGDIGIHNRRPWPFGYDNLELRFQNDAFAHNLEMTETDNRMLLATQRLTANVSLYLDSIKDKPRIRKTVKGKGLASKKVVATTSQWRLGQTIKLGLQHKAAIRGMLRGERSGPAVRFMVRGHWRNQPCGPGKKDRKLIRIEPFWKGPTDESQVLTRLYKG